jgi:hypothetical protein
MLRLTVETGQPVRTADGTPIGRVLDLTVRLGAPRPVVDRIAIGGRRRIDAFVPWAHVATFEHTAITLSDDASLTSAASSPRALEPDELLLVRDVLDTQIVDVAGRRVQRVGDVLLTRLGDGTLEVAAVEVGTAPVLRRIGLRRWAEALREQAVDWQDLHLTSARGHAIQLEVPAAALHRLDAAGLAHLLALLPTAHAADVVARVRPDRGADALEGSHEEVGTRIALALGEPAADEVIARMPEERARHLHRLRHDRAVRRRFRRLRGWRRFPPPPGHDR